MKATGETTSGTRLRRALWLLCSALALAPASASGQVVLDGSFGSTGDVGAAFLPDLGIVHFLIEEEMGAARGPNLYHSFSQFDIPRGQNATFRATSGSAYSFVFARVNHPSGANIAGTLRSIIPGADLFLMSPNGVWFGPDSRVDVPASLRVSTADLLRFPDEIDWATGASDDLNLTSAAPLSYGFLGPPAAVRIDSAQLGVDFGRSLSIVAGDIEISGTATLQSLGGELGLASAGAGVEVPIAIEGFAVEGVDPPSLGTVSISGAGSGLLLDVSSPTANEAAPGRVLIRAGRFEMGGTAFINAINRSDVPASSEHPTIDIDVAGGIELGSGAVIEAKAGENGRGGDVRLAADSIQITGAAVASTAAGAGGGGILSVEASSLDVGAGGQLRAQSLPGAEGDSGSIRILTNQTTLHDGGQISASTESDGDAGQVNIESGALLLDGVLDPDADSKVPSGIFSRSLSETPGAGSGGLIHIEAGDVQVLDGAEISSRSVGAGAPGQIEIVGADRVLVEGGSNGASVISARSVDRDGKELLIETGLLELHDGGLISASTTGSGSGGNIVIRADDVEISGSDPFASNPSAIATQANPREADSGDSGAIDIEAAHDVRVSDGGVISTESFGGGAGGAIEIRAGVSVVISDGGRVTASAVGPGNAGDIEIATDYFEALGGTVETSSAQSLGGNISIEAVDLVHLLEGEVTTSVASGAGQGGNISIDPELVLINRSSVTARADAGFGGNISISGEELVLSTDSVIDASSRSGVSGRVEVNGLLSDLSGDLTRLPEELLDPSFLLGDRCSERAGASGSLTVETGEGVPPPPDAPIPGSGWLLP